MKVSAPFFQNTKINYKWQPFYYKYILVNIKINRGYLKICKRMKREDDTHLRPFDFNILATKYDD